MQKSKKSPNSIGLNIIRFLDYLHRNNVDKSNNELRRIFDQQALLRGVCFGLSVCRASMKYTEKLAWWEMAMTAFLNWDEKEESLKKSIKLPQQEEDDAITQEYLFDKLTHYVLFAQASLDYYRPPFEHYNVMNFLVPEYEFFELLIGEKVKKIKSHKRMAGNFTREHFNSILNDHFIEQLKQGFCILHGFVKNGLHACHLGYNEQDSMWELFDPDREYDSNNQEENPYRAVKYKDKNDLINAVTKIFQDGCCIEVVSMELEEAIRVDSYEEIIQSDAEQLISGNGLLLLSYSCPEIIPKIAKSAYFKSKINWVDDMTGIAPLSSVIERGSLTACHFLIDEVGYDVNTKHEKTGMTPLMEAVFLGNASICKFLLSRGANTKTRVSLGLRREMTALDIAKEKKHKEIIALLQPFSYSKCLLGAGLFAASLATAYYLMSDTSNSYSFSSCLGFSET